jgi:PmbA protein
MQGEYRREMMNSLDTAKYAINRMMKNGADKSQCQITQKEMNELNVESGNLSLFRTTFNTDVDLLCLMNGQKGSTTINKTDPDSIEEGVMEVIQLATSAKADPANDIAGFQPPKAFISDLQQGDLEQMYQRLQEFLKFVQQTYPKIILKRISLFFIRIERVFVNSNGVEFSSRNVFYFVDTQFTNKDGNNTSSWNYVWYLCKDLNSAIKDLGGINRLLSQSSQQIQVGKIPQKFIGSVIITPECLSVFITYFVQYISNQSMISGASVFKDKLGQKIANSRLTLYSKPISPELADTYFFTDDGFEAKDTTIIEKGTLKSFLLDLYGSNKTGFPKAENMGDCYIIEPGDMALEEMIQSTPRGVLLCRFSGGNPSQNGDFSGVAKNSFYIENGKIKYPISETMVSGNIIQMLNNIEQISKERNNDGFQCLPWIKFNGITISGK